MEAAEKKRFDALYQRHLSTMKLQELSESMIEACAWAVRRVAKHFDCCSDRLSTEQLEIYFAA